MIELEQIFTQVFFTEQCLVKRSIERKTKARLISGIVKYIPKSERKRSQKEIFDFTIISEITEHWIQSIIHGNVNHRE